LKKINVNLSKLEFILSIIFLIGMGLALIWVPESNDAFLIKVSSWMIGGLISLFGLYLIKISLLNPFRFIKKGPKTHLHEVMQSKGSYMFSEMGFVNKFNDRLFFKWGDIDQITAFRIEDDMDDWDGYVFEVFACGLVTKFDTNSNLNSLGGGW
jgi:hypothetical protein